MEYEIIRSKRRTVSLEVKRSGEVIVRAPLKMSKRDIEAFVSSHSEWLKKAEARQTERREREPERTPEEIKEAKKRLKEYIMPKIAYYSSIMGVTPQAVTITSAATRFGSCSGNNRLSFTYRLVDYPEAAIDYVIVHELAHIKHHNHGKDFYTFIESVMPDYKQREKLLK